MYDGLVFHLYGTNSFVLRAGWVAQLVEHGLEKAGVGGSSPPLTTGNESRDWVTPSRFFYAPIEFSTFLFDGS